MCRYAFHNYRDHFACFHCRQAFKYWQWEECDEGDWRRQRRLRQVPREIICPDCARPMADMGLDFKAPRQEDRETWQILEALYQHGFTFHGCGWAVGVRPPRTLRQVPKWLEKHRWRNEGELLLERIRKRTGKS